MMGVGLCNRGDVCRVVQHLLLRNCFRHYTVKFVGQSLQFETPKSFLWFASPIMLYEQLTMISNIQGLNASYNINQGYILTQ